MKLSILGDAGDGSSGDEVGLREESWVIRFVMNLFEFDGISQRIKKQRWFYRRFSQVKTKRV